MSLPAQLPLKPRPHNNQQLFSDYYLDTLLPQSADWVGLRQQAEAMRLTLKKIRDAYKPSQNEAETEERFIRPVLRELGHVFAVQAALKTPVGTQKPDYVFFDTAAARDTLNGVFDERLLRQGAYAIGEAKFWDRPLDVTLKSSGDQLSNKNPAYQIAFYMLHSGLPWGILTNGRLWRLYQKDSAYKYNQFYEVDLDQLLADPEQFIYFYVFFRREAFLPGPLGLDNILAQSQEYARGVSDNLKNQVYDALLFIAQGFLDNRDNNLQGSPDELKRIYDASLILLYRLLFVLYAEARELLPVHSNNLYRQRYSLDAIKHSVAADLDRGINLLTDDVTLWPRLRSLFRNIDKGNAQLAVAVYNGGPD